MKVAVISWLIVGAVGAGVFALIAFTPQPKAPPLNGCGFLTYPTCGALAD